MRSRDFFADFLKFSVHFQSGLDNYGKISVIYNGDFKPNCYNLNDRYDFLSGFYQR